MDGTLLLQPLVVPDLVEVDAAPDLLREHPAQEVLQVVRNRRI